ncbi:MAG: AAA family ATPase [Acidobacteriota bacterium]
MKYGIYIAGGGKDAGKTTLSLGLVSYFKEHFPGEVAFTKPLGQKSTMVDGSSVGQDSYLLDTAMDLGIPLKYAAPFSTSSGAAEKYIKTGEPSDLRKNIRRSFNYLNSKYKYVVVEGTGHPGVGSVFDLGNADVASMLDIPVVLVLNGGIGSTIDRFSLSIEPFRNRKVRILGVIINKVLPEKIDKVRSVLSEWFGSIEVPVLGFVPYLNTLSSPSLGVLSREMGAETLYLNDELNTKSVTGFHSAFGNTDEVLQIVEKEPGSALVASAGRRDVIEAVLARRLSGALQDGPSAMILCGKTGIDNWVIEGCRKAGLPLFRSDAPFERTVKKIHHKIFKVEPGESQKIGNIVELIRSHVDMDMIKERLSNPDVSIDTGESIISRVLSSPFRIFGKLLGRKNGSD